MHKFIPVIWFQNENNENAGPKDEMRSRQFIIMSMSLMILDQLYAVVSNQL